MSDDMDQINVQQLGIICKHELHSRFEELASQISWPCSDPLLCLAIIA